MISVLGILILVTYLVGLIFALANKRVRRFKLQVLVGSIVVSLFVNLGNFVLNFSFTEVCTVLCLLTSFVDMVSKSTFKIRLERRSFILFTTLLLGIFIWLLMITCHLSLLWI